MIPVNTPLLSGNEKKYLLECISTNWISSEGPFISKFENQFSNYSNRKHGIAVSNGSAALDIAVKALGIGENDEVIVPAFTIISPLLSIVRSGAKPILVDSEINTFNIDINKIEKKITKKTKAILVVHIYGFPSDMDPILELCKKYNLFLIEDSAEMHGQQYYDKKCGSFGDISTFSFYPNKLITTGEGGMILTDNNELNEACRKLRNLAFEPRKKRFVHYEMGWNYRMTNLQAALGIAQLENIEKHINRKREIGKMYNDRLNNTNYIKLMPTKTKYSENIYWVYSILLEDIFPLNAEMMMIKLKDEGIGTRPFFHPMHLQPVFNKMGLFNNEKYPVAEKISNRGFYIPCGLGISDSEIQKVADALNKIISKY